MKADKGAAASGFCPPTPSGFSKPKPTALKKKKSALKESYRQLPKQNPTNHHTHTHTQTRTHSKPFSHLPSHLPPTQYSFLFSFLFLLFCLPPLHPGGRGYDCWWVATGTQRAEPHLWPQGGGITDPCSVLSPDTQQPAFPLAVLEEGRAQVVPRAEIALPASRLAYCFHLSPHEDSLTQARHHHSERDGHHWTQNEEMEDSGTGRQRSTFPLACS